MKYLTEYLEYLKSNSDYSEAYIKTYDSYLTVLWKMGITEDKFDFVTSQELENKMVDKNPKSPQELYNLSYHVVRYAKWCLENNYINTSNIIDELRRINITNSYDKVDKEHKYLSFKDVDEICENITSSEEYKDNALYLRTLLRAIYEGVYTTDWYGIISLTKDDIDVTNNTVTVHRSDGTSFKIKVSSQLIVDMLDLSKVEYWLQNHRYEAIEKKFTTENPNVIFKSITRSDNNYQSPNYNGVCICFFQDRFKYIIRKYTDNSYKAYTVFKSGIIYRIIYKANAAGYSIEDIKTSKDNAIKQIFMNELKRFDMEVKYRNFRYLFGKDF